VYSKGTINLDSIHQKNADVPTWSLTLKGKNRPRFEFICVLFGQEVKLIKTKIQSHAVVCSHPCLWLPPLNSCDWSAGVHECETFWNASLNGQIYQSLSWDSLPKNRNTVITSLCHFLSA